MFGLGGPEAVVETGGDFGHFVGKFGKRGKGKTFAGGIDDDFARDGAVFDCLDSVAGAVETADGADGDIGIELA